MSTIFVRNAWYIASFAAALDHAIRPIRVLGEPLILWRTESGEPVAMEDSCPHRRVPLSIATLVGDEVRCGYHGMQFDRSGRCTKVPGQSKPPPNARVRTYPVLERHRLVWVWMGATELADPATVPDLPWLDDPHWVAIPGYLHVEADYRLASDNLLDLSHETYVHAQTIGTDAVAHTSAEVQRVGDRIVRTHREMRDLSPPPFVVQTIGTTENVNAWQTSICMPPGRHLTESGVYAASRPRETAAITRVAHMLTPETDHSTHYFWAMCRNYRLDAAELGEIIERGLTKTFNEDRVVLELQFKRLIEQGNPVIPMATVKTDEAPVRARRMLAAMIAKEEENPDFVAARLPIIEERPAAA